MNCDDIYILYLYFMHSQLYKFQYNFSLFYLYSHLISIFFSVRSFRQKKKRELNCSAYSWRKSIIYVAIIYKWEVQLGGGGFFFVRGRKTRRMWNEHKKKKSYNNQSRSSTAAA